MTIQKQNRIAERDSAFVKQWADEFSKLINDIDATAIKVLLLYFKAAHLDEVVVENHESFLQQMMSEIRAISLRLDELNLELEKYTGLAPNSGPALGGAFMALNDECRDWFRNQGGDARKFRDIRIRFNQQARKTHVELLHLDE